MKKWIALLLTTMLLLALVACKSAETPPPEPAPGSAVSEPSGAASSGPEVIEPVDPGFTFPDVFIAGPLELDAPSYQDEYGVNFTYEFKTASSTLLDTIVYTEGLTAEGFQEIAQAAYEFSDYGVPTFSADTPGEVFACCISEGGSLSMDYTEEDQYMDICWDTGAYSAAPDYEAWAKGVSYYCGMPFTAEDLKYLHELAKSMKPEGATSYGITIDQPDTWDSLHIGVLDVGTDNEWAGISARHVIHRT